MLVVSDTILIPDEEVEMSAIRAQGAGGQNVNKVSSAIHLRFDIRASTLPEFCKENLLSIKDQRITQDGVVIIKAQNFRTQEKNKEDALARLVQLIQTAIKPTKVRRPTKPTRASKQRRVDRKTHRGKIKSLRGKPIE
jgi:ribosome-associated protein